MHAAIEHAEGEPHKKAYDLHLKEQALSIRQVLEVSNPNSGGVLYGLYVMKQKDSEKTKKKFETMYFVVKEELPITKFSKILELEERHGVELGNAYHNSMSGSIMIDFIGKWLSIDINKTLEQSEFFSILTDRLTDVNIIDKEAIFAITYDPSPPGTDMIGIRIFYISLEDLCGADAKNVLPCIKNSVKSILDSEDFIAKLVGFGSDGASVNASKKGVQSLIQHENPWITFG